MSEAFFSAGKEFELGGKRFTFAPFKLSQTRGELIAWCRDEPIRQARETIKRIEACRDVFGDETDAMKRDELKRAIAASASEAWGDAGELSGVLIRSLRGTHKQLWLSASASAKAIGVDEAAFVSLVEDHGDLQELVALMLAANGVKIENPQAAAKTTGAARTGTESLPPLQAGTDTPPVRSGN
ncbi:MAG: hypothetical protein KF805_12445 [Phycisphaeraceae bacterium]|nr:hypothetical protein [Phycisphaeraceae bacterium]